MIMMETRASPLRSGAADALRGVLILGADEKEVAAGGIAAGAEMAARIIGGWRSARRRGQRMFAFEGPEGLPVVVVVLSTPDATVLVAMEREGRDALFELAGSVEFASDILAHFLTNPFEALVFVDREGVVRYISPVHERFFDLKPGSGVGRRVTEVIENSRLHHVAATGKAEIGWLHDMRGVTRVVSRHPIHDAQGDTIGAIGQLMFKGPDHLCALAAEVSKLKSEVGYYRRELDSLRNRSYGLEQMVGESLAMRRLKEQIGKVAPLDVSVLLIGESGTGKELAAHAIHKLSLRRDSSIVMLNAATLPSTLVESELFGYEAGSFTGAERKGRQGKIEQANDGTLFFDEIGDMPVEVQVKLLRVLQDGSFQRLGGNNLRRSDFRLISASNRDFAAMIAEGAFRLDLFYRIGGVTIRLPPLRERVDDIPLLADLALRQFAGRHGLRVKRLSGEALEFLRSQGWPGNVRQLMHTVERAAIFSESDTIGPVDFGLVDPGFPDASPRAAGPLASIEGVIESDPTPAASMHVSSVVGQVEAQLIRQAMARLQGNKKRVAAELGISRSYLYKRLAQMEGAREVTTDTAESAPGPEEIGSLVRHRQA